MEKLSGFGISKLHMEELFLVINSIDYLVIFHLLRKRFGWGNLGVLYFLFYTILSFLSIHLYITGTPNLFDWKEINLFPLLYQQFFIAIFCILLARIDYKAEYIAQPQSYIIYLVYVFVITFSLLDIINVWEDFSTGIILLATDDQYGAELYNDLSEMVYTTRSGAKQYISVIANITKHLAPILFLHYMAYPKKNIFILLGLGCSSLVSIMSAISIGSRLGIVQEMMNIIGGIWLMRRFYSRRIILWMRPIGIAFGTIIMIGFLSITLSRAGKTNINPLSFVESYASQSFLYFGSHGFNNEQIRYGDRTIPLLKSIFAKDVARSYIDRVDKYKKMKINEKVFVSFVGDCVFDYGVIGGTIFLFLLYSMFRTLLLPIGETLYFDKVVLTYMLIWLLNGFYAWPYSDFGGNLSFISLLLLSLFFRKSRKSYVYKQK